MGKEARILNLNITGKWFDMIESGEKLEEYREIKEHYVDRFFFMAKRVFITEKMIKDGYVPKEWEWKSFGTVRFMNGTKPTAPVLLCDFEGICIGTGRPEWGAVPGREYFVISLSNPRRER